MQNLKKRNTKQGRETEKALGFWGGEGGRRVPRFSGLSFCPRGIVIPRGTCQQVAAAVILRDNTETLTRLPPLSSPPLWLVDRDVLETYVFRIRNDLNNTRFCYYTPPNINYVPTSVSTVNELAVCRRNTLELVAFFSLQTKKDNWLEY